MTPILSKKDKKQVRMTLILSKKDEKQVRLCRHYQKKMKNRSDSLYKA